ncbi:hypothetical protein BpHYR1_016497 [Brachionus plicatilis]|uniref:Uncharacterized protein n=1 Tax=Brachionus plicatilis TaxID=10195 RepID=A0A3M7Q4F7_BRAPC|nr:hypothetical protein BpHYR1_016497 [Brachionus plicatilis]
MEISLDQSNKDIWSHSYLKLKPYVIKVQLSILHFVPLLIYLLASNGHEFTFLYEIKKIMKGSFAFGFGNLFRRKLIEFDVSIILFTAFLYWCWESTSIDQASYQKIYILLGCLMQ